MGFMDSLLGRKPKRTASKKQSSIGITISDVMRRPDTVDEKKAKALLREATVKHDLKDFDGAVDCLKQAYALIGKSTIEYPVATFLRLPLYLQKAGRFDESVIEFEKLLQTADSRDVHIIKNKMKLAEKRELKRLQSNSGNKIK